MASQQLTEDQIAEVSSLVAVYIKAQREKALPLAVPLSPGWFLPATGARYRNRLVFATFYFKLLKRQ